MESEKEGSKDDAMMADRLYIGCIKGNTEGFSYMLLVTYSGHLMRMTGVCRLTRSGQ